jgi:hypothetical protein
VAGIGISGVEEMADQAAAVTMMAISGRRAACAESLILDSNDGVGCDAGIRGDEPDVT